MAFKIQADQIRRVLQEVESFRPTEMAMAAEPETPELKKKEPVRIERREQNLDVKTPDFQIQETMPDE